MKACVCCFCNSHIEHGSKKMIFGVLKAARAESGEYIDLYGGHVHYDDVLQYWCDTRCFESHFKYLVLSLSPFFKTHEAGRIGPHCNK